MGHVRLLPLACLLLLGSAAGAYAFQAPGNGRFAARRAVATNGRFAARRAVATHRLWMAKDAPAPAGRSKADAWETRRAVLQQALRLGACGCAACAVSAPRAAVALAKIVEPPKEALDKFDLPRDAFLDAAFACGMATGMADYEEAASVRKAKLFRALLSSLPRTDAVIAEVGMGSFPNAPYYAQRGAPGGMDIIGIDPNDKMASYAQSNARRARVTSGSANRFMMTPPSPSQRGGLSPSSPNTLRCVHGVSEALPLADECCDAVVCTLTLCSVVDPVASIAEIQRILKPGGKFLFWEHVLSETDEALARQQVALTPQQVKRADGCHLNRRTGETIKAAGFAELDLQYLELEDFGFLNPTVAGIATV